MFTELHNYNVLLANIHMRREGLCLLLTLLFPKKLYRKINTSQAWEEQLDPLAMPLPERTGCCCLSGVQQPGKCPHPAPSPLGPGRCCWRQGVSTGQSCGHHCWPPPPCALHLPAFCSWPWSCFPQSHTSAHPSLSQSTPAALGQPYSSFLCFPCRPNSIQVSIEGHSIHLCMSGEPLVQRNLQLPTKWPPLCRSHYLLVYWFPLSQS